MTVLAVVEHDRGEVSPAVAETMTGARELAGRMGVGCEALVIGDAPSVVDEAGRYGARFVRRADHELLSDYGPEAWGEVIAETARTCGSRAVVAAGTDRGNEMLAHAAARTGAAMVANVVDMAPEDPWTFTRLRWGGSLREKGEVSAEMAFFTFAPHSVAVSEDPGEPEVVVFEPGLSPHLARTTIVSRELRTQGMTLATAPVVVGGGRGVGSVDGFAPLEELAGLLGGVVGCSRVATNNGWRPHTDQVGQTGTRIAPDVYIACGISGAIQHWVGAMAAKSILAINTDAEANMVAKADYAVVGDLHEVVPAISAEIRRRRS
jgi:electron transfer flavoprotein alpha subunit